MVETTLAPPEHKTVLVVEDNVWSRKLLETRLEIHGFRWVSSSDGELALEIAREQRPDLILMDIQLPGISGVEAIRRLKRDERTRTIPIIAVTAFALSSDKTKILDSGCDAYMSKPIDSAVLMALIERYTC
jgi:two-component system, cell cycle response regulator DivK